MKATINTVRGPIEIKDEDLIPGTNCYGVDNNYYGIHLYCLCYGGEVVGMVFARSASEAMDEFADADRLDRWLVTQDQIDLRNYEDGGDEFDLDANALTRLGNAGEPFALPFLPDDLFVIPTPPLSVVALLAAAE